MAHPVPDDLVTALLTPAEAAAPGQATWLRYNFSTGATRTGSLTDNGIAVVLRDFPLDPAWSHLLALGGGRVAAYKHQTGILTIGEVAVDGTYADVRDNPEAETAHNMLVVFPDMLLFYLVTSDSHGYRGLGTTGRIAANGAYTRLSEPILLDFWTHIVPVQDGLVLFYNSYSRLAAVGRFTGDGGFADLRTHPGFDPWTHIFAATDGTLLFYNVTTGMAASGRVEADGGFTNLRSQALLPGMSFLPTRDGRVLIARPADTLVARFPVDGWFFDARIVNGLILPVPTLFVR